jgi:hypothetical protein
MVVENSIFLWAVGALTGSMVFFAVVVAPKVFQVLPPNQAGTFLRAFFPNYYLFAKQTGIDTTGIIAQSAHR